MMSIKINSKTYQAIIFDVDDTLIDTSQSYDEAIKQTVKHFTSAEVNDEQISLVRTHGIAYGVNNDWNVTWLLIELVKQFPLEVQVVEAVGSGISSSFPKQIFLKEIWEEALTNHVLNDINPESTHYLEINAFFQNIYLGNPPFNGQGLIDTAEKNIYTNQFFPTLKALGVKMAVVTSRPTDEALYTLKNVNGLIGEFIESEYFMISVGSQDAQGHNIAEKPSPEPILACINRLKVGVKESVYIGNSAGDYIAARNAGVDFIQVGDSHIQRDNEPAGFNYLKLDSVNDLLAFLLPTSDLI